jgi:hypothetical protein
LVRYLAPATEESADHTANRLSEQLHLFFTHSDRNKKPLLEPLSSAISLTRLVISSHFRPRAAAGRGT